jgi:TRAP-type uncharacterized transport system substrate-binding protein
MVGEIKLQLTLQSVMQNMMDGHHQLAMMQQHQHQNNGQQRTGKKGKKNLRQLDVLWFLSFLNVYNCHLIIQ